MTNADTSERHRHSVFSALSWNTGATLAVTGLQTVRAMILGRLLSPEQYGLFGIAATVAAAVSAAANINTTASLIARPDAREDNRVLIDSAWTFDIMRQCCVTLILLLVAHPAGRYFEDQRVVPILLVSAFLPAINSLLNVGMTLARKSLDFRTVALQRLLTELFLTGLSVSIAFFTRSVWALVAAQLIGAFVSVLLSYALHRYRPRFRYDRAVLADSLAFGKSLFVITLMTYVTTQFDTILVGKYAGAALLGAYMLAQRITTLPADILSETVGSVLFPSFSRANHAGSIADLSSLLLHSFAGTTLILSSVLIPLHLASEGLVRIIYGSQWTAAPPLVALLCFTGLFRGLARAVSPLLLGLGKATWDARAKVTEAVVFVAVSLTLVPRMGVEGAPWAGIISYALALIFRVVMAMHLVPRLRRPFGSMIALLLLGFGVAYVSSRAVSAAGASPFLAAALFPVVMTACCYATQPVVRETVGKLVRRFGLLKTAEG